MFFLKKNKHPYVFGYKYIYTLFLHCNVFGSLWSLARNWLGISSVSSGDLRSHFIQFTKMAGMPRVSYLYFMIIWFATIWVIWKERNNRIFQNTVTAPFVLIDKIKLHSFLWLKSKQMDFVYGYVDWGKTRCFACVFFDNCFISWMVLFVTNWCNSVNIYGVSFFCTSYASGNTFCNIYHFDCFFKKKYIYTRNKYKTI